MIHQAVDLLHDKNSYIEPNEVLMSTKSSEKIRERGLQLIQKADDIDATERKRKSAERKKHDDRVKVLVGSCILHFVKCGELNESWLTDLMSRFHQRPSDRNFLGFTTKDISK